jgi:AcrR family transcriptional regulator
VARKSAAVRREEILAATVEEIEATGLRALRVSDVAARLGLSASLVIYHFETKEALVAEAFDFAGRQDIDRAREMAAGTASAGTDAPDDGGEDDTTGAASARGRSTALGRLRDVVGWYLPSGSSRSWKIWIDALVGRTLRCWSESQHSPRSTGSGSRFSCTSWTRPSRRGNARHLKAASRRARPGFSPSSTAWLSR